MLIATTPHAINPSLFRKLSFDPIKGFESSGWYALLGPAHMPREVVLRLNDGFSKALRTPDITRRLSEMGVDVVAGSPEVLAKVMPREITKWAAAVKASGAKAG